MRKIVLSAAGSLVSACATVGSSGGYIGRPIAEVVQQLGPPHSVADYQGVGRYFTWGTSDMIIMGEGADNEANWLTPFTRIDRGPGPEELEAYQGLPPWIASPPFKPDPCSLTLVAQWDGARRAWIARKAIRKDAGKGGRCGLRIVEE